MATNAQCCRWRVMRTSAQVQEEAKDYEDELVSLLRCLENSYRLCVGGRSYASAYDFAASAKELMPLLGAFVLLPAVTETKCWSHILGYNLGRTGVGCG